MKYDILPEHIRDGVQRYIDHGIQPGGFLTAVICNDLIGVLDRADDINCERLHDIVSFFYMEAPSICWGSPAAFHEWCEYGGLEGLQATEGGA